MSLVKILQKPIKGKEPLIFLVNADAPTDEVFYSLSDKGRLSSKEVAVDYDAVRGYLDEQKIPYSAQGEISVNWILRLKNHEDIVELMQFLAQINGYAALEARVHSDEDDERIKEFKNKLVTYASKYKLKDKK